MKTWKTWLVLPAVLVAAPAAGCSVPSGSMAGPAASVGAPRSAAVQAIQVVVGDRVATASLDPGPASESLVSRLPITTPVRDAFGVALVADLTDGLEVAGAGAGAGAVERWTVGEVAYDPDSGSLAFVHADDSGQLAPPGVVRLGTVTSGLDALTGAGPWATATIRVAG